MTGEWTARYPDLAGKTVVVAATADAGDLVVEVVRVLAHNRALVCVVCPDRVSLHAAVAQAEAAGCDVMGLGGDVADPQLWSRVTAQAEQRLGPIDAAVAVGEPASRAVLAAAVVPDMTARRRGVVVEVGDAPLTEVGALRSRLVSLPAAAPGEVAAAVLLCLSDTVLAPRVTVSG